MNNTNKLPYNWVIDMLQEKDSILIQKFMDWYESISQYRVHNIRFVGKRNAHFMASTTIYENQEIITLEQWNEVYFPEWEPKQNERILVGNDNEGHWQEKVFVMKYNNKYFTKESEGILFGWDFAKPVPNDSKLQPKIDELKSEAERLGLEIEVIIW